MKKIFNIIKKTFYFGLFISFFTLGILIYFLWRYSPELPSYTELKNYNPSLSSRVFTSDGVLLDKYFVEERIFVPIERIPQQLINAFLSAEDKNFFKHLGIDPIAIVRASFTNIVNKIENKKMIGASTITQQVVKNLLLSNEISLERKFKEMILAIRIENILQKHQILELYLNDIYLGYGSYGVATASLNYFNKSLEELTIDEMAFLAALPKAPNNYNPKNNYNSAIERRNWVLDKMHKNNYITKDILKIKNNQLIIRKRKEIKFSEASYFKEEVRKELYKLLGSKALYENGLIIKTSINTNLQRVADKVLVNGLIEYDKRNGWRGPIKNSSNNLSVKFLKKNKIINPFPDKWIIFQVTKVRKKTLNVKDKNSYEHQINLENEMNNWLLESNFAVGDIIYGEWLDNKIVIRQIPDVNGGIIAIDPHSGKILALSGGFSFNLSEFNRVTQARRQPGSAFKPFVYITALKEGYTPATLILDAPYVVDQGPGLPKWKPSNYTEKFYGLSSMRTGIEKSRNLMTIRLSDKIGMKKIIQTAELFKIDKYMDENLSMSLGAGVVTLRDLTNAYAMIVNGGKELNPKLILSVYDKKGKQIINNENKKCYMCKLENINKDLMPPEIENFQNSVLDSRIAYQITSMLEGVVTRGTGKKISALNIPLGGKTGTTNENKDAWFIGFSPDLTVGVYVGFDKPKSLGFKQTGSAVAVPIFRDFMREGNINSNKIPFRIPSGISFVKINPKLGLETSTQDGILEAFIVGTEPFNKNGLLKLDDLGTINNNSISGTGSLLMN